MLNFVQHPSIDIQYLAGIYYDFIYAILRNTSRLKK